MSSSVAEEVADAESRLVEPSSSTSKPQDDSLTWRDDMAYWASIPWHWARGMARNGSDILRVLDLLKFRPFPAGLVGLDHPWVTGISPHTGEPVWFSNVILRSPPNAATKDVDDKTVLLANGRFLMTRVRQSAVLPELPIGRARRMPHAINYMHGSSHYNSGIILLNDLRDAYRHVNDPRFRAELRRFVACERREVLFLLRNREYDAKDYAYLSCCMRTHFHWFCNPNGPGPRVLWGNYGPYPAANLITGHWSDDVYALRSEGGASKVARPPVQAGEYFQQGPYDRGRDHAVWPEKMLAYLNYYRVRARGAKGGMFFVDRRHVYSNQIANRQERGLEVEERAVF
ncbi:MAG: hypothetical protein U1A77_23435 [Pirellulales bacterium]